MTEKALQELASILNPTNLHPRRRNTPINRCGCESHSNADLDFYEKLTITEIFYVYNLAIAFFRIAEIKCDRTTVFIFW